MRKILVAMDTSKNSLKAVEYAASVIDESVQITLFHVFYKAYYGSIPGEKLPHHDVSFSGSTGEFKQWLQSQRIAAEEALEQGRRILVKAGADGEKIKVKIVESEKGVARDILNETERGGYDTIVIGRRGTSDIKQFLTGNIADKIVRHAHDCAVWVVG